MKGETEIYSPDQVVFREGDPCNGLFFVKDGKIEVYRERDGVHISFGFTNAGEVLGTLSIFTRDTRSASARAVTQVTLLHVSSESLESGMKDVPVWAQAVLKDTILRLKTVDEKLVDSKLQEHKLLGKMGTPFQHASSMAAFMGAMMRLGVVNDDGIEIFPCKDFVNRCESVLLRRAEYLQKVFDCFAKAGLVKLIENKKFGTSVQKPSAVVLEEFAIFALQAAKSNLKKFAPAKLYPWMSALVRLGKKFPDKEAFDKLEISSELSKEMGRTASDSLIDELAAQSVLRLLPGGSKVSFNAISIGRRIVFENVCRLLKEVVETD